MTAEGFSRLRPEELVQVTTPIFLFAGIAVVVGVSMLTRQHHDHSVAEFYARLDTPLGEEHRLREAGFQADTLEELDRSELNAADEDRDVSPRLLLPDLFRWPGLVLRGEARLSDYRVDFAGLAGSVVFILLFLKSVGWLVDWLRP